MSRVSHTFLTLSVSSFLGFYALVLRIVLLLNLANSMIASQTSGTSAGVFPIMNQQKEFDIRYREKQTERRKHKQSAVYV